MSVDNKMVLFSFCNTFELLQQIYLVGLWYQQVDVNEISLGRIDSLIMPFHQYVYSLYCSICISYDSYKENLFDNYVLLLLVIISFTLMTFTFDSPLVVWEEIRSLSPLGARGLVALEKLLNRKN